MFGLSSGNYYYGDCVTFDGDAAGVNQPVENSLYGQSVVLNTKTRQLFVKLCNAGADAKTATIDLSRFKGMKKVMTKIVLCGQPNDENNFETQPIAPKSETIKTQKKIEEAKGGILFIDEAYTLAKEGNDFGQEAIDTILKAMEDNRKDLVVIVAGYTDLMKTFINSNPGLKSRFNKYIDFKDYTADELIAIFNMQCDKYNYTVSPEAKDKIENVIRVRESLKGDNFANARDVRNLFETVITNQASRVAQIEDPDENILTTIEPEDIEELTPAAQ
jgi:Cdc6-like AAA superfamily ATPase